jgi:hypothetical protein
MAGTLNGTLTLKFTPSTTGQQTVNPPDFTFAITVAGDHHSSGTIEVGTSMEALDFGDITNAGCVLLFNTDQTNYVEFNSDADGTNETGKIKPNEPAFFRIGDTHAILNLKANAAACNVQYWVWED